MKKILLALGAVLFVSAVVADGLLAGTYNFSYDPSWTRMMARAATTDAPDAVYYNPAGLVKIKDGLYIDIGNQMGAGGYQHKFIAANYASSVPVFIDPNLSLVLKKDKAAVFMECHIPSGGGSVLYENKWGIATLISQPGVSSLPYFPTKVKGSAFWIQGSAGGSYAFTDWLAITGCVRYSSYSYEMSIGYMGAGTIQKTKTTAGGFSGAGGIMVTPLKELAMTMLYSTEVIARGKTTDMKLHYSHIDEARLPDYLLVGINVRPNETMSFQVQYQLVFSSEKDYGSRNIVNLTTGAALTNFSYAGYSYGLTGISAVLGGNIQDYKNHLAHQVGFGGEFLVHRMLVFSLGVQYKTQIVYPRAQNPFLPDLKDIGVGLGFKITPVENFSIQIGGARYFYFTDRMLYNTIKMNRYVWTAAIGLTGKIL
jgi:long-subunit fatty acid transport protein